MENKPTTDTPLEQREPGQELRDMFTRMVMVQNTLAGEIVRIYGAMKELNLVGDLRIKEQEMDVGSANHTVKLILPSTATASAAQDNKEPVKQESTTVVGNPAPAAGPAPAPMPPQIKQPTEIGVPTPTEEPAASVHPDDPSDSPASNPLSSLLGEILVEFLPNQLILGGVGSYVGLKRYQEDLLTVPQDTLFNWPTGLYHNAGNASLQLLLNLGETEGGGAFVLVIPNLYLLGASEEHQPQEDTHRPFLLWKTPQQEIRCLNDSANDQGAVSVYTHVHQLLQAYLSTLSAA